MDKVRTKSTLSIRLLPLAVFCIFITDTLAQGTRQPQCEQGSCYPATGDLLIGREKNLTATSTCGLNWPNRYCVVSYLEKDTKCFTCDSREPYRAGFNEDSHTIENIVSSFKNDRKLRWWQAEAGKESVSIQLDLEAEFHFTHMIMTFKTFRPKAMFIERSFDFGRTWKVYRYFAQNCRKSFPQVTKRQVHSLSDVICDQSYSAETPSTEGEVIFRVLPPFLPIPDPYSEEVQDLLKLTNLRINFTELHTLGDTLLDSRSEIKEKYYYALYDVTVRGSCSCYGHASRCLPVNGAPRDEITSRNMVHGKCECTHNTKGLNCEICEDFYQDQPWRPARPNEPNICKRCNCNNHASKCHFDAALYQASGEVSGGVCDDCQHNTMGVNCQECKDFFFQDPFRDIRDPEICQYCDCEPDGSINRGKCQKITDEEEGTIAGHCECKEFVEGVRCDKCKDNYYGLSSDNPLGCTPCRCNPDGTYTGQSCDAKNGTCLCKRYVAGPSCNKCYPGYYGLSADNRYGCKACDCDIGGSVDDDCDQVTGQCRCRPHIRGRRCNEVEPGYFFPHLDYYLLEAEYGKGSGNARVIIKEPQSVPYWTGSGTMQVMSGDSIEFQVSDLPFNLYYDIVIRYDPRMTDPFEDIRVAVIRPEQVDPDGYCGLDEFNPRDDIKSVSLRPDARWQVVQPSSCLERDTTYTIRIDFNAFQRGARKTDGRLFIDSILIVPNLEYVPFFFADTMNQHSLQDFLYRRCDVAQFPSVQQDLSAQCSKYTFSTTVFLHNGALACACNVTGSTSLECNPSGGQCQCKDNVMDRSCDQCVPGAYGFGPNGCLPCNCHSHGARDSICEAATGQCSCHANIGGRICDRCIYGHWGFPQCRPCQCNGNAETCDPLTGACINCRNNTGGDFCERCEQGYYGDPRAGIRIPCKSCMCPGGPESAVHHADSCRLDRRSQDVICRCKPGFTGRNCERCIDNHYGNPMEPGRECAPCVCNNNINPDDPGSCDASTGECLKCLYNTEGFACEHCKPGYHGDATRQSCQRCVCNRLGTDSSAGECDRVTGQCPCLPGVVGLRCDQCAPNHWNITSGRGCSPCGCDPRGSEDPQCNQLDGTCSCVRGRGGDKCADCEDFYYGDPNVLCQPCDCLREGSRGRQCERRTGQCDCVEGVTGSKCDRCARGTTGDLPNCVPCGECFDNWDKIIKDLSGETHNIVRRANDVSVTGAIKAFDEEFRMMQSNIDEIKKILAGVNLTQVDIRDITEKIDMISENLTNHTRELNDVERELRNSSTRVKKGDLRVELLKGRVAELKALAKQLRDNATDIQIREAGGAFDKVVEARRESQAAQDKVDGTASYLQESESLRNQTERLVKEREQQLRDQLQENTEALDLLENDIDKLDDDLADINGLVCGEPGDPCSSLCGGGGCDKCGGPSCNGAATLAEKALSLAKQAEEQLNDKTRSATEELVPQIEAARQDAMDAHDEAKMAFDAANNVHNQTEATNSDLKDLLNRIREFMIGNNTNSPDDVEKVVDEVLNMSIPLSPDEIKDMAEKISQALSSLTDIDKILDETEEKRKIAEELKMQAKEASDDAQDIRNTAQVVRNALDEAKMVQERAEEAIEQAKMDIMDAEDDLKQISNATGAVNELSDNSRSLLEMIQKKLDGLTQRYTGIKNDKLDEAESTAQEAEDLANKAYQKALELNATYAATSEELNNKHNDTERARDLSQKLKERADSIFKMTETQRRQLKDIESKLEGDENRLTKLSDEILRLNLLMDGYLTTIREKAKNFETC